MKWKLQYTSGREEFAQADRYYVHQGFIVFEWAGQIRLRAVQANVERLVELR